MRFVYMMTFILLVLACSATSQKAADQPPTTPATEDPSSKQVLTKPSPELTKVEVPVIDTRSKAVGEGIVLRYIPGGSFNMGSSAIDAYITEKPAHRVTLNGFWMGETEITNAQYAAFLNETKPKWEKVRDWICMKGETRYSGEFLVGSGEGSHISANYQSNIFNVDAGWENFPVTCVSWEGADAFCRHYGLRLPTEAEWEFAAGGPEHHVYPWGDEFAGGMCCWSTNHGQGNPPTMSVKSFPSNGYGLFDMAGNIWECVNDWYDAEFYAKSPEKNPTGPDKKSNDKVYRGGCFESDERELCCTVKGGSGAHFMNSYVGFRVAGD